MGTIKKEIEVIGDKKSKKVIALFDSGAYRNYVKKEFIDGERAEDLGFHIFEGRCRVILANGEMGEGIKVRFRGIRFENFYVEEPEIVIMDNLIEDAIIGVHLMQKLGMTLNFFEKSG